MSNKHKKCLSIWEYNRSRNWSIKQFLKRLEMFRLLKTMLSERRCLSINTSRNLEVLLGKINSINATLEEDITLQSHLQLFREIFYKTLDGIQHIRLIRLKYLKDVLNHYLTIKQWSNRWPVYNLVMLLFLMRVALEDKPYIWATISMKEKDAKFSLTKMFLFQLSQSSKQEQSSSILKLSLENIQLSLKAISLKNFLELLFKPQIQKVLYMILQIFSVRSIRMEIKLLKLLLQICLH